MSPRVSVGLDACNITFLGGACSQIVSKKLVHKALEVPDFNNIQEAMISLASAERIGLLSLLLLNF